MFNVQVEICEVPPLTPAVYCNLGSNSNTATITANGPFYISSEHPLRLTAGAGINIAEFFDPLARPRKISGYVGDLYALGSGSIAVWNANAVTNGSGDSPPPLACDCGGGGGGGSVTVTNFPATQAVSGTVSVGNFPATQQVGGNVTVDNFPAPLTSIEVSNFPATQQVEIVNAAPIPVIVSYPTTATFTDLTVTNSLTVSNPIAGDITGNAATATTAGSAGSASTASSSDAVTYSSGGATASTAPLTDGSYHAATFQNGVNAALASAIGNILGGMTMIQGQIVGMYYQQGTLNGSTPVYIVFRDADTGVFYKGTFNMTTSTL